MNSHDVTVVGYLVVLLAGIVLQLLATRTRAPIPPLGKVFAWAMSTRTRRVGLLVAWAWVGLHFFARLSRSSNRDRAIPFLPLANGHFPAGASYKAPACRYIFRSASKKPVIMA